MAVQGNPACREVLYNLLLDRITMETKNIKVTNLSLDLDNPRFEPQGSQLDAINKMVDSYKDQLYKLAVDILDKGLNPTDKPLVIKHPSDNNKFIVLEGNRRITVLKILLNPDLVDDKHLALRKKFAKLVAENKAKLIHTVECAVCTQKEDADVWIERKHANGMGGIGTQQWDSIQKQRFEEKTKGKTSMALQVLNMLSQSPLVPEEKKKQLDTLKVTNLERLVSDPKVRECLGISWKNGRMTSDVKKEVVTNALVEIVDDMLKPDFKVSKIYHKSDRETYMNKLFRDKGFPNVMTNKAESWDFVSLPQQTERADEPSKEKPLIAIKPRVTLIPRKFKLPITQSRVAVIFKELSQLSVKSYANTSAVMLRVFLEMSVDIFIETFNLLKEGTITSSQSGKSLKQKILIVVGHLKDMGVANKDITKGIEMDIDNPNSPLSVDSMNSYVHNYRLTPVPDLLITEWDNIQPFVECLWQEVAKKEGQKSC